MNRAAQTGGVDGYGVVVPTSERTSPTGRPWPRIDGTGSAVDVEAERAHRRQHHRHSSPFGSVGDLHGDGSTVGMGDDVDPLGAALGQQARHGAHQGGVLPTGPGDEVRMRGHRLVHLRPADRQRPHGERQADERDHRRRCTTAVDTGVTDPAGRRGDVRIDQLLHRVVELQVAVDLPPVGHARRQHRGVFAAAVLEQRRWPPTGPQDVRGHGWRERQRCGVAEGALVEAGVGEDPPDDIEMHRFPVVAGGGDGELVGRRR